MHVRRLQLTNFRTYRQIDLQPEPGRLLFLGDNAQGKSNLLEAVYMLSSGKSARAGNDGETIAWQGESESQPFARLQAEVERQDGLLLLETLIVGPAESPSGTRAGKRFRVNAIPRRSIDFVGQLRAVLFTADDLDIVSGPPSARRQYLDATLSQLDRAYHGALQRFGRIVQQRNATLRRIREGVAGNDELMLWDGSFCHEAGIVMAERQNVTRQLGELARVAQAELSGAASETLALAYQPQLGSEWRGLLPADATPAAVEPLIAAALASQRRREVAAGLCLIGPHRDELSIELNGASAASFGSRAQIRTAALALRLAEARLLLQTGAEPPVILLDDVVSELDERRRRSVVEGVSGFDQVWFTATSDAGLPPEFIDSCRAYRVRGGAIEPL